MHFLSIISFLPVWARSRSSGTAQFEPGVADDPISLRTLLLGLHHETLNLQSILRFPSLRAIGGGWEQVTCGTLRAASPQVSVCCGKWLAISLVDDAASAH